MNLFREIICSLIVLLLARQAFGQPPAKEPAAAKSEESISIELESAKRAYSIVIDQAGDRLMAAFEGEEKKLVAAKGARVEDKLKRLESLREERAAFEADGTLPESAALRAAVNDYRLKVTLARSKCEKAFETAADGYFKSGDLPAAKAIVASKDSFLAKSASAELPKQLDGKATPKKSSQRKVTSVPQRDGEWIQLFNGKDLDGWKQIGNGEHTWRVEDGLLVGSGKSAPLSVLTKEGPKLSNFHLRCDVMCPRGERAGLAFRVENRSPSPVFYVATLGTMANRTGNLCFVSKLGRWGPVLASALPADPPIAGQWLRYEVIAENGEIIAVVDGKPVSQFQDSSPLSMSNIVGLVCNAQGEPIKFRMVEIIELPTATKSKSR